MASHRVHNHKYQKMGSGTSQLHQNYKQEDFTQLDTNGDLRGKEIQEVATCTEQNTNKSATASKNCKPNNSK